MKENVLLNYLLFHSTLDHIFYTKVHYTCVDYEREVTVHPDF
jgi:hypothetical protein